MDLQTAMTVIEAHATEDKTLEIKRQRNGRYFGSFGKVLEFGGTLAEVAIRLAEALERLDDSAQLFRESDARQAALAIKQAARRERQRCLAQQA